MNEYQLRYFISVARHLSFTEAAKEYYISQPAISKQIHDLEKSLGVELLTRHTRKVTLSPAGKVFLEDAKKIVAMTESASERVRKTVHRDGMSLSIGHLQSPTRAFLSEILAVYHKRYPHVELNIVRHDASEIVQSIAYEEHDIYLSVYSDLKKSSQYQCKTICNDAYCLVTRKDHPILSESPIRYRKLSNTPFVFFSPESGAEIHGQIIDICKTLNIVPNVVATYDLMEDLLFAVDAGIGITILPRLIKGYLNNSLAFTTIDLPMSHVNLGIAWKKETENPAMLWFLDLFNQFLIEKPELFSME